MARIEKEDFFIGGGLVTFSLFIVPLFTFWFGTLENPFNYTLSMIGNRFDRMTEFIIWGIFTGVLLVLFIWYLYKKTYFRDKQSRRLLIYSNIFLVFTCVTPAIEEVNAFTHRLHALFGALFAICLNISLFFFVKYLRKIDENLYSKSLIFLIFVVFGSLLLFVILGNNGIFELYFFLSITAFLFILSSRIHRIKNRKK